MMCLRLACKIIRGKKKMVITGFTNLFSSTDLSFDKNELETSCLLWQTTKVKCVMVLIQDKIHLKCYSNALVLFVRPQVTFI